jgi:hypothetical protein
LASPSSYRPLCLLDSAGKLLEKIVEGRVKNELAAGNDLADCQFGFRKRRSTVDAVKKLLTFVEGSSGSKIGVLTFDVRNAFKSASWTKILAAAEDKGISYPILRLLDDYFKDHSLLSSVSDVRTVMTVTSGVPQGSVLGPTLWNIMYDGLLREQLPAGVEFLAYADDVALVARGKDVCILERLLTSGAGVIVEWMASMGLELALHKSEAMVITNSKTHNDMRITIKGTEIATVPCIKYLGIHLDAKLNFTTHAMYVSAKASKVAANLARILPNISQAKPRKRRLLSGVVHSILLYGAPVWADRMS